MGTCFSADTQLLLSPGFQPFDYLHSFFRCAHFHHSVSLTVQLFYLSKTDPASLCRGKEAQSQAISSDMRSVLHWQQRQPAVVWFLAGCQRLQTDLSRTHRVSDSAQALRIIVITLYWVSSPFQCGKDQGYMNVSPVPVSTSSLNYSGSCQVV